MCFIIAYMHLVYKYVYKCMHLILERYLISFKQLLHKRTPHMKFKNLVVKRMERLKIIPYEHIYFKKVIQTNVS